MVEVMVEGSACSTYLRTYASCSCRTAGLRDCRYSLRASPRVIWVTVAPCDSFVMIKMYHRSGECASRSFLKMQWLDLPILFPEFEDPERWLPLLQRHQELLDDAAPAVRVTSVSAAESIQRHYAESLEIWRIALAAASAPALVADVGSGGGFPGLVMACVTAASHFALIEPLQKRARLLESIAASLGLQNVEVL